MWGLSCSRRLFRQSPCRGEPVSAPLGRTRAWRAGSQLRAEGRRERQRKGGKRREREREIGGTLGFVDSKTILYDII